MINEREQHLPQARKERLLIEILPDEVLVYDLDRKKAHCLNKTAALIWNYCDGETTIYEMGIILQDQSSTRVGEDVVWFGLDQLRRARLIDEIPASSNQWAKLSRRELVKQIGLAVSIPLVVSILAPTASAALSCVGRNCASPAVCGVCVCDTLVTHKCV